MEPSTLPASSLSTSIEEYTTKRASILRKRKRSLYDILELDSDCKTAEVRRAYYHFARLLHPDKCQDEAAVPLLVDVQSAYDILGDEYKRMLYDLKNGFRTGEQLSDQLRTLGEKLKERYSHFLQDHTQAYIASVLEQYNKQGLMVKKALYGNLSLRDPQSISSVETIEAHQLKGPFIEVTVQLQLLIEHGVLHVNPNGHMSYAFLPGFYNPMDFVEQNHVTNSEDGTQLYILYLFKGDVHEVTLCDGTPFKLPMKAHLVYGSYIKGPYAVANLEALESA
ncbi:domain-containing protein, putative [Babesia ovata]|uniref:Domain-containing protein, putative n=1 Tax=Babesia ovata TaxID=189622 RepID=A0A2H6KCS6_9APIC|nr:domain-containing protein, putative [Babesia ovata]GBE60792.1 domain-containing protein, putative [Babesia ovata]